ncbi:hypothetical protein QUW13_10275, partial [Enterococcus hirae]|nr:hypothetical protein [Enterococcus hirae]
SKGLFFKIIPFSAQEKLLKRIHFLKTKNPKRAFLLAWNPLHFIHFESSPTLFDEEPKKRKHQITMLPLFSVFFEYPFFQTADYFA